MENDKKVGLCLSGGGFRAMIYHLGTLRKLRQMGILDKVDVISSVSGGSIIAAYYVLKSANFEGFEAGIRSAAKMNFIRMILRVPRILLPLVGFVLLLAAVTVFFFWDIGEREVTDWLLLAVISLGAILLMFILLAWYQFEIFPFSRIIESIYSEFLYHGKTLGDLPQRPEIVINSTNVETGRPFTFSRGYMGDSTYTYPDDGSEPIHFQAFAFPIAKAVSASTCVPGAFTPVKISARYVDTLAHYNQIRPRLVDGGVFDNQGIHKLTQTGMPNDCRYILVSDAGAPLVRNSHYSNSLTLLGRTMDVFMARIKNFQLIANFLSNHQLDKRQVAYHCLGWDAHKSVKYFIKGLLEDQIPADVMAAQGITPEEIAALRTRVDWTRIRLQSPDLSQDPGCLALAQRIKTNIQFERIIATAPTPEELTAARTVKTGLSTLSDLQTESLIKQAEVMTELHVRLYCPHLCA
jgi:NTE family protein